MNLDELWEDRRIKILVIFVVVSLILIGFNGISKGIDLEGGSRINLKTERTLSQKEMAELITILETRLNFLGLKDVRVNSLGENVVQIEIAGVTPEEVPFRQGKLTVKIGNTTVFTGAELERVESFGKNPSTGSWVVPFTISEGAAQRFMDVSVSSNFPMVYMYLDEGTQIRVVSASRLTNIEIELEERFKLEPSINVSAGIGSAVTNIRFTKTIEEFEEGELDSIVAFINNTYEIREIRVDSTNLVNSAPIGDSLREELLAGQAVRSLILETGGDEAGRLQAKQVEAVLRSGSLTVKVEVIEKLRVPAELGEEFTRNAVLAGFFAIVAVGVVIFIRYRDTRIVVPIIATGISEVIIILGIASLIRWNIDLPAIAGIIAAVGTAWMTTVAAMFPLFSIGLQILRGFALTTTIGVTIGVAVTRPAYASLIRNIIGDE
jgi:preprotein translocase subunit SecD